MTMSFGLKNAGATYQRAIQACLKDDGDSCAGRAEEDGPVDAWLVETAGFVGWLATDGISSWLVDGIPCTGAVPPPHRLISPIIFDDKSSWAVQSSSALSGSISFGYPVSRRLRSLRG